MHFSPINIDSMYIWTMNGSFPTQFWSSFFLACFFTKSWSFVFCHLYFRCFVSSRNFLHCFNTKNLVEHLYTPLPLVFEINCRVYITCGVLILRGCPKPMLTWHGNLQIRIYKGVSTTPFCFSPFRFYWGVLADWGVGQPSPLLK